MPESPQNSGVFLGARIHLGSGTTLARLHLRNDVLNALLPIYRYASAFRLFTWTN